MDDLSRLFQAYRDAVPDPDASADFTPGLWKRIDARRSSFILLRRFTQAFVTLAALVTILFGVILIPHLQSSSVDSTTYVDVLAAAPTSTDQMLYSESGGAHTDSPSESPTR
jgi:hypothetical protein